MLAVVLPVSSPAAKFVDALHGLRGVAAFAVFVAHCAGGYSLHLCQQCQFRPALEAINHIGNFGVEVFFLLSGFVIYSACLRSSLIKFLAHRFWRIYPVFLFFTAAFFIGNHFLALEPDKDQWQYLIYNLAFVNLLLGTPALTPNAWTITYEVMFYLLAFGLIQAVVKTQNRLTAIVFTLLALWFLLEFPISLYFVAGVIVGMANRKYNGLIDSVPAIVVRPLELAALALLLFFALKEASYQWSWLLLNPEHLLAVVVLAVLVCCLLNESSLLARCLKTRYMLWLGTISYSLYLAHPYSYLVTRTALMKLAQLFQTNVFTSIWIFSLLVLVLTIVFSAVVHYRLEAPVYRLMTGKSIVGARRKGSAGRNKTSDCQ